MLVVFIDSELEPQIEYSLKDIRLHHHPLTSKKVPRPTFYILIKNDFKDNELVLLNAPVWSYAKQERSEAEMLSVRTVRWGEQVQPFIFDQSPSALNCTIRCFGGKGNSPFMSPVYICASMRENK
jgi:hypothetical protein